MSLQDDFKTTMVADSGAGGVNTLLTGGIYVWDAIGKQGITRERTPNAFNGTAIKPHAVIKARGRQPFDLLTEAPTKIGWRQVVEIYLADDGFADASTLETVHARLLTLFHGGKVGNRKALWVNSILDEREKPLNDALLYRVDFAVFGVGVS